MAVSPRENGLSHGLNAFRTNWLLRYAGSVGSYSWRWQRRRKLTWLLTVGVVGLVLSVAATVQLMVWLGEGSLSSQLHSASEMQVFLSDGSSPEQQAALKTKLLAVPGVKSLHLRSKAEAAGLASKDQQLAPLAAASDGNPFPASFVLQMKDPSVGQKVLKAAGGDPAVDAQVPASYTADQAKQLSSALGVIQVGTWVLDAVALGVAILVALALLRGELRARKEELRILTLVGVPRAVIRLPLVLQALSVALGGSLIAILSLIWVGHGVVPVVSASLPFLRLGDPTHALSALSLGALASACLTLIPCSLLVRLPR
jgi:cell division transport system permease protein